MGKLNLSDPDSPEAAIWQLVESCGYTADLGIWSELAAGKTAILDLGCGIGRVSRHLARGGHEVIGLDIDPVLIGDLNRLARDESVTGVVGSAIEMSDMDLDRRDFDLVIAPQQLLHIVGGEVSRQKLIDGVKERLEPGGTAAFAISEWITDGSREVDVLPDVREVGDWVYASRPVAVEQDADSLTVVRLRQIVSPEGELTESEDRIKLDRMDRFMLFEELAEAGLEAVDTIDVPQTDRHIATVIIIARHGAESA